MSGNKCHSDKIFVYDLPQNPYVRPATLDQDEHLMEFFKRSMLVTLDVIEFIRRSVKNFLFDEKVEEKISKYPT